MSETSRPTLLLVHGAWHGAWCWTALQAELAGAGWVSRTVELPSVAEFGGPRHGMYDDAEAVRAALAGIDGPVVVVAHSYAGAPVTEGAAGAANVQHIVYLTAFQLDEGESLYKLVGEQAPPWWLMNGDTLTPDTPHEVFYGDVDKADADRAVAQLRPQSFLALTETVTAVAWRTIPSSYVICEQDNAIPVPAQEMMAARAGTVYRLNTSHSPFVSRPAETAALLVSIVGDAEPAGV